MSQIKPFKTFKPLPPVPEGWSYNSGLSDVSKTQHPLQKHWQTIGCSKNKTHHRPLCWKRSRWKITLQVETQPKATSLNHPEPAWTGLNRLEQRCHRHLLLTYPTAMRVIKKSQKPDHFPGKKHQSHTGQLSIREGRENRESNFWYGVCHVNHELLKHCIVHSIIVII